MVNLTSKLENVSPIPHANIETITQITVQEVDVPPHLQEQQDSPNTLRIESEHQVSKQLKTEDSPDRKIMNDSANLSQ